MVVSKLSSIRRKNGDFLPWKKFVFPDPLAPTAKKKIEKISLKLQTNTIQMHSSFEKKDRNSSLETT